jgi:hypothetical protein
MDLAPVLSLDDGPVRPYSPRTMINAATILFARRRRRSLAVRAVDRV